VEPPGKPPTLARFLLDQLYEAGVDTIFGIPGDFILQLSRVIEEDPRHRFLTLSHEPGVGFAASGAARGAQGLGVACVTYGAGALNLVNPIAAAYAEKTPVLVLTGGPGQDERAHGYQAVLDDPQTAADQIRYAIDVCRLFSRPVYLEVPRDMVETEVRVGRARVLSVPSRPDAASEAAAEIVGMLSASRSPVLVVGVEVHRQRLAARFVELAERLGLPVVTTFMARGAFPDDHPQYAGTYLGPASPTGVREVVEGSDCLLLMGVLLSDTNMGVRLSAIDPRRMVLAVSRSVEIGYHRYQDIPLDSLIGELLIAAKGLDRECSQQWAGRPAFERAGATPATGAMRVAAMIAELNRFLSDEGEMPLVTDTGDCLFCSHELDTQLVLSSAYYATMGFGVPAAMGFEATGGDRPLVLVGDGGFQMTGWELVNAPRWGVAPIVVVMNNGSWEMLQSFMPTGYNELVDGRYAELARLWGIRGWHTPTAQDFRRALTEARGHDGPCLIEVPLARGDISRTLATFARSVGTTPPPPE
jgi:indolepyruvate decarboxylase